MRTLALYRVNGFRSAEYPGVWVTGPGTGTGLGSSAGEDLARHSGGGHRDYGGEDGEEKKIASVGVRLRRYVSSYGIALNISTDLSWFERIVACGLPGNKVTSMERLGCKFGVGVEEVAEVFEGVVVGLLGGVEGVKRIGEEDVLALEKVVGEEATKEVEG